MTLEKILDVYKQLTSKHDISQLLSDLDLHIFHQDIKESSKLFMYDGYASIILNIRLEHEAYYILHEIGHFVMHQDILGSKYGYGKAEFEANMFACIYLLNGNLYDINFESKLRSFHVPANDIARYRDTLHQYFLSYQYYEKQID